MKMISVVIPVYNEQYNVSLAYTAIREVLMTFKGQYDYEIIFMDNRSTDGTFTKLKEIAEKDIKVKVVRFSRNFGYQRSIYTGFAISSGDAVIQFDSDLQDPLDLIKEFIKKWEEGFMVVYGVRRSRKEGKWLEFSRKAFYRLINALSEDDLPPDAGDFRLVDKKVVELLRQIYDYSPYLRGTIASFGFNQLGIPYDRLERKHGRSKFNFLSLIGLAVDGILNHSISLLRLATFTGFLAFIISIILVIIYSLGKLVFFPEWRAGFTTTIVLILISLGLNAFFLGIIGEYIGRIYQQVKKFPIAIIDESMNLEKDKFN